ncbi:hypothetical protein NE848_09960 [Gramella jeungdoensis]|uniref:Uncharacterized protein n=1 Tax=Gramella jeungdoensis TaxID=708091 RepID=A0ABT0Z1V5_9FLAO|nr:hypothetical protein [Gramella jeungdoensis]MCM8569705.1 hypothetical protein [Gramella jeungdoensis]
MKHYSFEILNKLISEIYPFTSGNIEELQDYLDFQGLSRNKNIKWSLGLITEFYNKWDWEALEENRAVFDSLTLGLFFPDKVTLPACECYRKLEFCDYASCRVNYNKFHFARSLHSQYPQEFIKLAMMCESGFIDFEMVKDFYMTKNSEKLLRFRISI